MELFHKVCKAAVDAGASDLHIKIGVPIVFRINRQLVNIDCTIPTKEWMETVAEHIVPKHAKRKLEEEGEADFSYYLPGAGRFRTNLYQQRGEWCLAMRYVKTQVPGFEELGLLPVLKTFAETPRGIVLLAGTTGCGKSTTLAAMIEHINAHQRRHVITMEDPIEYVFEDNQCIIEQREVGLDTQSFHSALRNVLRQDPDVIMIGEMRDAISFGAAMSAADTGHLVLSTVHTTNSSQSIIRILDFFRADDREQVRRQLAGTLLAVVTQRMTQTLAGGVTPALEILINTPIVRKLIEENRLDKLPAAIETGVEDGMQNFNQALYNLVTAGKVSKEEALNKATNAQSLEMNFKGIFLDEGRRILG
ncbi:MAG: PilT/PilU family type 4a pilus ATPase [Verrucomicrobia bacterium]|nr:PilT/PilU family type 4a pilus ATPase [Verrucomicrobiota bacterium]